jgi:phosphatidylinositol alpha-1,6-mannosyltransferase
LSRLPGRRATNGFRLRAHEGLCPALWPYGGKGGRATVATLAAGVRGDSRLMHIGVRCLALVGDAFGGRGGIAQYNRDFLSALADSGLVSSISILPRRAPDPFVLPPRISQAAPRLGRTAYIQAALRGGLDRPVDTVFCGHLHMAPLALLIARWHRAKLIVHMHGIEAWPRPGGLQQRAVEAADLILCVSRYTRARVTEWASIAPERVLVLPNTVGEAFTPGDGSALREAWGLQDKLVLLTVGRMDAREGYKGHDRVITALPQLLAAGYDVVYVVVGEGNDRARLQNIAAKLGAAECVRFVGVLDQDVLVDAYRMADLFVMPSSGEGFGIVFLEAIACGAPAFGLAEGGAVDALADGEFGTMASEAEFSAVLARLLAAPKPDPHALAAAVRSRFGYAAFSRQVSNILARTLRASAAPSAPARTQAA